MSPSVPNSKNWADTTSTTLSSPVWRLRGSSSSSSLSRSSRLMGSSLAGWPGTASTTSWKHMAVCTPGLPSIVFTSQLLLKSRRKLKVVGEQEHISCACVPTAADARRMAAQDSLFIIVVSVSQRQATLSAK